MPTYRTACCLKCHEVIIVNPPLVVDGVLFAAEGALCPNCILYDELPDE